MQYSKPVFYDQFFCTGERCPAPCPAPVDMTWTRTLGGFCETGLSMACPKAAELMLLRPDKITFRQKSDGLPEAPLSGLSRDQLTLLLDARKTVDLLLQDRELGLRSRLVLVLTYCAGFEPLISAKTRFAYEELDWGFTEQPNRQFQALVQLAGHWELKRSDMCNLLLEFQRLSTGDDVLSSHIRETLKLFGTLSGEDYRLLREQFDQFMEPREYLFENLLVYFVHRYFLASTGEQTVAPGVKLMAVSFALLRAMAARIWRETGDFTDSAFLSLCWHYARCAEEQPHISTALGRNPSPLYGWERLERLLWI